jgi:excinuclease ABC subunit A
VGRTEDPGDLELLGVRTRNLKDVDVRFPRGKWTSLCGVSGSGKSSLAFHTLHAEAERRWLSTLPAWRRLLSDALPRPELRSCKGLSPTSALRQESQDAPGSTL